MHARALYRVQALGSTCTPITVEIYIYRTEWDKNVNAIGAYSAGVASQTRVPGICNTHKSNIVRAASPSIYFDTGHNLLA